MWYVMRKIKNAKSAQLEKVLQAVISRYGELHPGWEISTVSIEKASDRAEQLDRIIATLEKMKIAP